jgi:hypothetical protein
MKWNDLQTFVKVGAEGGPLTLEGVLDEGAAGDSASSEMSVASPICSPMNSRPENLFSRGTWVTDWEEALAQLDRYPWAHLYPLAVHPALSDRLLAAVRERLADGEGRHGQSVLSRWQRLCCDVAPVLPSAPATLNGSLAELFARHIEPVLPAPEVVRGFHDVLVEYASGPDPLFVVRLVAGLERGHEVKTAHGRFRPSDNSPAARRLRRRHDLSDGRRNAP